MQRSITLPKVPSAETLMIPPRLEGLRRMAYNLWWTWHPESRALFRRIDPRRWTRFRNPVGLLRGHVEWQTLLTSADFLSDYDRIVREFDAYVSGGDDHWFPRTHGDTMPGPIAYFCAEYGFHEALTIYSGGLGVLAGDHMKAASDMALPLVGVGLLYRRGYFRQTIDADGHQEHAYPELEPTRLPLRRAASTDGSPLRVSIELPGRSVYIDVWIADVGRVPVVLLDTDLPENDDADRPITHILYVRGREMRLHQELVLGVGGVRALRALGVAPAVWHLNEGHSAFSLVERARELVASGRSLDDALAEVKRRSVFTIHTPVSAGNERFDAGLVRRICQPLCDGDGRAHTGGVPVERVLGLARGVDGDPNVFDMTALSLRMSNGANAVSQLHAATANSTWKGVIDRPIKGVTNGVHVPTWVGGESRRVYERHLDADLDELDRVGPEAGAFWERLAGIDDVDWWRAHQRHKEQLGHFLRHALLRQLARHGESPGVLREVEVSFDPQALTIGFARRFATYKRANLLFRDVERIARILGDERRPVQLVFAGKAHPADRPGQGVIQEIFQKSRSDVFRGKVFVLEDYDMRTGRFLVQGCDVWLNTPRRPLEASGTSGMKAAANGCVNVSILDGWWDEGFDGKNGWAIGGRDIDPNDAHQDWLDSQSLYKILEEEVVPKFYDRDERGIPRAWLEHVRASIASNIWRFSTTRMLHEYCEELYLPGARG